MKLFLWRKVLVNYAWGMAFAIAEDVEQAKKVIMDKRRKEWSLYQPEIDRLREDLDENEYEVLDLNEPFGYYIEGGE